MTEQELLDAYGAYHGSTPVPSDFDAFWDARMAEADAVELSYRLEPAAIPAYPGCVYHDLYFTGIDGARLHAKVHRPVASGPVPVVLQFHGYPGSSRSWLEHTSFCGLGMAIVALDNPGQGGSSRDAGGFAGPTVSGHIIDGLEGPASDLYYVRLHQSIRILVRIVSELEGVDPTRMYANGASQGGGLALATAALNPCVSRVAALYPFLSDFRMVWELGADEIAYEGLRYFSHWRDPQGTLLNEWFGKLAYVDTVSFAHRIPAETEVFFGTGLADQVCPPPTQMAVYNELVCKKCHRFYPGFAHEEIQDFDDEAIGFFCKEVAA